MLFKVVNARIMGRINKAHPDVINELLAMDIGSLSKEKLLDIVNRLQTSGKFCFSCGNEKEPIRVIQFLEKDDKEEIYLGHAVNSNFPIFFSSLFVDPKKTSVYSLLK